MEDTKKYKMISPPTRMQYPTIDWKPMTSESQTCHWVNTSKNTKTDVNKAERVYWWRLKDQTQSFKIVHYPRGETEVYAQTY